MDYHQYLLEWLVCFLNRVEVKSVIEYVKKALAAQNPVSDFVVNVKHQNIIAAQYFYCE